mgnify:CR=1 FL=1
MRLSLVFAFLFSVFLATSSFGQETNPVIPLKIKAKKEVKPKGKTAPILLPEKPKKKPNYNILDSLNKRTIDMRPDNRFVKPGRDLKLSTGIGEKEKKAAKKHFGNQYLGDIKSNSKFVGIVCRDHEYVDGDRVKIYANGEVAEHNILLTSSFKGINLDLKKGFNQIDFEALNQGTSGPNTAQVDVYDDKGNLIFSKKWNLSTGSKATMIITKSE